MAHLRVGVVFGGVWSDAAAVFSLGVGALTLAVRTAWGVMTLLLGPGVRLLAAVTSPLAEFAPTIGMMFGPAAQAFTGIVGAGKNAAKVVSATGGAAAAAASVGKAGVKMGAAAGGVGGIGVGLSWLDLRLWRDFGLTVFRAVQRIVTFLVYVGVQVNAHRLSLGIASRRRLRRWSARWMRFHGLAPDAGSGAGAHSVRSPRSSRGKGGGDSGSGDGDGDSGAGGGVVNPRSSVAGKAGVTRAQRFVTGQYREQVRALSSDSTGAGSGSFSSVESEDDDGHEKVE